MSLQFPLPVLVDRRNFAHLAGPIRDQIAGAEMLGFDIETEDSGRHEGLNQFMKIMDPEEAKKNKKLVFDLNRTTITGFSLYPRGSKYVFYFNLNHIDIENRLSFEEVKPLLDQVNDGKRWQCCHNAPFEIMMLKMVYGYELKNVICTLQLAVTAYGPDEYDKARLLAIPIGEHIKPLLTDIHKYFTNYERGQELNPKQADVVNRFIGKESDAEHAYNGIIRSIRYGYGLKEAVASWFGYQMTTFQQCLNGRAHMGQLRGDEVVAYGCDDAFWVLPLYDRLMQYLQETNPDAIPVFFAQENPMTAVYAETACAGIRVNREEILRKMEYERGQYAAALLRLKTALRSACTWNTGAYYWPFIGLCDDFAQKEKPWYLKSGLGTQQKILTWISSQDDPDPFTEVCKVNGAVAETWHSERFPDRKKPKTISLTHYYVVRVLLYDLLRLKPVMGRKRVVESDGDARNLLMEGLKKEEKEYPTLTAPKKAYAILKGINELVSIEQRMKLYITPYLLLTDPETSRMYPILSSQLATRRMAGQNPNFMQLAKSGEGAYVRGFFEPDNPDDLILSIDWSQIELVLIGDQSGDPEFQRCYSQIPYEDLHRIAMGTCYHVAEQVFDEIKKLPAGTTEYQGIKFQDKHGEPLSPQAFYKYVRTKAGKVANFNYWYSGALAAVGEQLGWSSNEMWEATDAYRKRFFVAEKWRVDKHDEVARFGFLTLPDALRRVRFEATMAWVNAMSEKFASFQNMAFNNFADVVLRRIQKRALNQAINALIQGSCSTLAKRSILRIREHQAKQLAECAGDWKAKIQQTRFMQPIHDELVFNVQRDYLVPFLRDAKAIMCHHPDVIRSLPIDSTASIGLNFRAFDPEFCPFGQIELDEAPAVAWLDQAVWGKRLNETDIAKVINYLFKKRPWK